MVRKRLDNLVEVVKLLKQRRVIADGTYYDYMSLIWSADTPDQLKDIAHDLADICYFNRGSEGKKIKEKEEDRLCLHPSIVAVGDEVPANSKRSRQSLRVSGHLGVFVDLWV